jgi:hypothetical protein
MRSVRIGPLFAVFVLFFGLALFEAIEGHHWLTVSLFAALAFLFLRGEVRARRRNRENAAFVSQDTKE